MDYYNDCGVGGFRDAIGPFDNLSDAEHKCKVINDLNHYATEAEVYPLEEKYWGEK